MRRTATLDRSFTQVSGVDTTYLEWDLTKSQQTKALAYVLAHLERAEVDTKALTAQPGVSTTARVVLP